MFKQLPRDPACVNAHVWSLFLHFFTWFQAKPRQKRRLNISISLFLHRIAGNKWHKHQSFDTSWSRHNVIDTRNVFANKTSSVMIRQCRNAFPCNVMQTNQLPDRLCQVKSHVNTARESHDLKMDCCGFKQLQVTNSYARILFLRIVLYNWSYSITTIKL